MPSEPAAAPIPDDETPGAFGPGFVYNPAVFGRPNVASRNDNPEAWVSGGHEKFETPVIPIRDEEHPALKCPRGCVDTEGCGCAWNVERESAFDPRTGMGR